MRLPSLRELHLIARADPEAQVLARSNEQRSSQDRCRRTGLVGAHVLLRLEGESRLGSRTHAHAHAAPRHGGLCRSARHTRCEFELHTSGIVECFETRARLNVVRRQLERSLIECTCLSSAHPGPMHVSKADERGPVLGHVPQDTLKHGDGVGVVTAPRERPRYANARRSVVWIESDGATVVLQRGVELALPSARGGELEPETDVFGLSPQTALERAGGLTEFPAFALDGTAKEVRVHGRIGAGGDGDEHLVSSRGLAATEMLVDLREVLGAG